MDFRDIPTATDGDLREALRSSYDTDAAIRRRFRNAPEGLIPRNQIGALDALEHEERLQAAIEEEQQKRRKARANA